VAAVKKEIEDELDKGLPESYNPKVYEEKCDYSLPAHLWFLCWWQS